MPKAILIKSAERSFTEVEYSSWEEIAPLLGCDLFDVVQTDHCSIYLDDEGLLRAAPEDLMWLMFDNDPNMVFAGDVLLVGNPDENGDATDCRLSIDDAEKLVQFVRPRNPAAFLDRLTTMTITPF